MAGNGIGNFEFIIVQNLTTLVYNKKDDPEALYEYTCAWLRSMLDCPQTDHYDTIMAAFISMIHRKTAALDDNRNSDLLDILAERFKHLSKRDIIKTRKYYETYYYNTRNV